MSNAFEFGGVGARAIKASVRHLMVGPDAPPVIHDGVGHG